MDDMTNDQAVPATDSPAMPAAEPAMDAPATDAPAAMPVEGEAAA